MLAFKRLYLVGNVLAAVSEPVTSFHCFRILAQSSPLSRMLTSMRSAAPASAHEVGIGKLLTFVFLFFRGSVEFSSVSADDFTFAFFGFLFFDVVGRMAALCSGSGLMMFVGVVSSSLVIPNSA